jgi:hypothetical protein
LTGAGTLPGGRGGVVVPPPIAAIPRVASQPIHRPAVKVVDSAGGQQGGSCPGAPSLPPLDPEVAATFLVVDTAKKVATFQLAAGNELTNQVSFNGARRGGRILIVPVGWRLVIEFANRDTELPHSATVVAAVEPIPEQVPPPAFPHAQTVKIDEGLLEGDSDEIGFVVDRAGRYLIACGVLGHAQRGQWLVLEVSTTATVPTYR